jgi:hypothetical protein
MPAKAVEPAGSAKIPCFEPKYLIALSISSSLTARPNPFYRFSKIPVDS